jgi:alkylated DNA repair dioxygenase AlkB
VRQPTLFETGPTTPEGFAYQPEVLSRDEEAALLAHLPSLPFEPFQFHGYEGKRRVVSFGWKYEFNGKGLRETEPAPGFLEPARARAAAFLGVEPEALQHVLLTEYAPGAAIGWHRDRPEFGEVVGLSLGAPCTFRFRRKQASGWERVSFEAEPRSAYRLTGPARSEWEHSIPAVERLRYSITFRTLRGGRERPAPGGRS